MPPRRHRYIIPVAVITAVLVIAGAAYIGFEGKFYEKFFGKKSVAAVSQSVEIRPIDATDHILGDPNASVILVEYADFECPFCKRQHETLQQIMKEFGKDGRVALVYRHFPLVQLHSKAPTEALAAECAAAQGGNDAFWKMADAIFAATPGNNQFDLLKLPELAQSVGLARAPFETCLVQSQFMDRIERDFNDARNSGARGAPYTVLIAANKKYPLVGVQNFITMKTIVSSALIASNKNPVGEYVSPSQGYEPYPGTSGATSKTTSSSTTP